MKSGVRELESTFREQGLDCRGARDRRCEGSPKDALQVDPDGSAACIVLRDQGAEEPEPGISAHARDNRHQYGEGHDFINRIAEHGDHRRRQECGEQVDGEPP